MKKRTLLSLALVLGGFILMSCTCSRHHVYYTPPSQNVPMLKEKGDMNLEAGLCDADPGHPGVDVIECDGGTSGLYIQGAYSPRKNIGLALNFMSVADGETYYSNSNGNITDLEGSGKGWTFDIGGGYYTTLDSLIGSGKLGLTGRHLVLETYAGIGYSGQKHYYRDSVFEGNASLDAFIFYAQPAIGINLKWVTLSVSLRMNNFYYYSIHTSETPAYPGSNYATTERDHIAYLRSSPFQSFIEPAFTLKLGWKYGKLSFQYCGSTALTGIPALAYEDQRLSVGLQLNIAPRYKKVIRKD